MLLCISTSTISDGKDMNWTLHTIGATGFFLIAIYMCSVASSVYRKLYLKKQFCNFYSYQLKKYINFFLIICIVIYIADALKLIHIGSLLEWTLTFYIMAFFFSLYFDFDQIDIMLHRKRSTNPHLI